MLTIKLNVYSTLNITNVVYDNGQVFVH